MRIGFINIEKAGNKDGAYWKGHYERLFARFIDQSRQVADLQAEKAGITAGARHYLAGTLELTQELDAERSKTSLYSHIINSNASDIKTLVAQNQRLVAANKTLETENQSLTGQKEELEKKLMVHEMCAFLNSIGIRASIITAITAETEPKDGAFAE